MTTDVQVVLDNLAFRKRHTRDCQTINGVAEWETLDRRKRCACPYWSCGVHGRAEGFKRKSTGEISQDRAKAVVKLRLETGNRTAALPGQGTPIKDAIADFVDFIVDRGARESTLAKYRTLMDQLQAFADWKSYTLKSVTNVKPSSQFTDTTF
jgi:hypothetical protein